jgi:hypothetical protein
MNNYDDIINIKNYKSKKRPQMSIYNRSAQFSPFAALTGYEESIDEASRITLNKSTISQDDKKILDIKFNILNDNLNEKPLVNIIYFIDDLKKQGGKYISKEGYIKKFDYNEKLVVFDDNTKIKISNIIDIQSEIFDTYLFD